MKRDGGPRLFFVSAGPDHPVPSDGLGFHKENSGSDVRRRGWTLINVSCSDTRTFAGGIVAVTVLKESETLMP